METGWKPQSICFSEVSIPFPEEGMQIEEGKKLETTDEL